MNPDEFKNHKRSKNIIYEEINTDINFEDRNQEKINQNISSKNKLNEFCRSKSNEIIEENADDSSIINKSNNFENKELLNKNKINKEFDEIYSKINLNNNIDYQPKYNNINNLAESNISYFNNDNKTIQSIKDDNILLKKRNIRT